MKDKLTKYDLVLEENGCLKIETIDAENRIKAKQIGNSSGQKLKAVVFSDQNTEVTRAEGSQPGNLP